MIIYEDKGNKEGKHIVKNKWWADQGVDVFRIPLPVGDYVLNNPKIEDVINRKAKRGVDIKKMDLMGTYDVSVDSKQSIMELINDFQAEHERFRDEMLLAKNNGIKLYIVVENTFQWIVKSQKIFKPLLRSRPRACPGRARRAGG